MISEHAATAVATVATICWCVQLIPQIIYNYRRKDCTGLPPLMMFLWVVSGIPFGIYFCVSRGNIILQIQPHLFMFFCAISFVQSCYYPPVQLPRWKICAIVAGIIVADVGMELGFILGLRPLYDRGIKWPDLIFGIIATILLGVGLLPPYFELWKRKGRVVGINFAFLFIDSLGAWLSIVSVVLGNMDVMGIILYCVVAGLEVGIFTSHIIWCCRFKWFNKNYVDDEAVENPDEKSVSSELNMHNHDDTDHKSIEDGMGTSDIIGENSRELNIQDDTSSIFEEADLGESERFARNSNSNVHAIHGVIVKKKTHDYSSLHSLA